MTRACACFVGFLILLSIGGHAQPPFSKDIKGLYKHLAQSGQDTARVNVLVKISRYYNSLPVARKPDSALITANLAHQLAVKLSYPRGEGLSFQEIARNLARHHNPGYKTYIDRAVAIFKENKLLRDEAEAWLLEEQFYLDFGGRDINVRIGYYDKARPLFARCGAIEREAATLSLLGDFYQMQEKYPQSLAALKESLALYQKTKFRNLQGLYDLLGAVSNMVGNYPASIKYGLLAVATADSLHDRSPQLCTIFNRLAGSYKVLQQFSQAETYARKSLDMAVSINDTLSVNIVLVNYSDILLHAKKSAIAVLMLHQYMERFPTKDLEYIYLFNLTFFKHYTVLNRLGEAELYYQKLAPFRKAPYVTFSVRVSTYLAVMKYLIAANRFDEARRELTESSKIGAYAIYPIFHLTSMLYAFKIDSAQGNASAAIKEYQQYDRLKDSIYNAKMQQQVEEIKIQYETEKKEKDISLLKKESQEQREKARQANKVRNLIAAGLMVALALIGLLYYSYRVNRKNAREISKNNVALAGLLTEKEWLLKEIHHRVKNNLQIVMGLLQRQSAYIDNESALEAIQSSEHRMQSIALIHQKLYQSDDLNMIFMPEYIEEMISYLQDTCELERRVFFEKQIDEISLDVAQAVPLGLILNEAITNIIKYAYPGATSGIVYISMIADSPRQIDLTIADNGPGLPEDFDTDQPDSLGLSLMKGLARQIGGTFDIRNEQGCLIHIQFSTDIITGRNAERS